MQTIAIIPISEAGSELASKLKRELEAAPPFDGAAAPLPCRGGVSIIPRTDVGKHWNDYDAFIFIGAMGICVRTIAPYIKDKHEDPAVVCVDSLGQHAISVLSGHIGGANDLTRTVSGILGAEPVITTQSDNAGLWALDTLYRKFNWTLYDDGRLNDCIFAFVNRQPTALLLKTHDEGTDYLLNTLPAHVTLVNGIDEVDENYYKLYIVVSPYNETVTNTIPTLQYIPNIATIGFGLAHQAGPAETIYSEMEQAIMDRDIYPCARQWCTIDVKADEPFVALLREKGETVRFFTAEELATVEVPNPSAIVAQHVGTPSVCEAAAILGADSLTPSPSPKGEGSILIIPKVKGKNWTMAVAGSAEVSSAGFHREAPLPCRNGNEDHREAPLPCRGVARGGVSDFNLCGEKLQTPPPTPPLKGRGERTQEADAMLSGDNGEETAAAPLSCRNGNEDRREAPLPCRGGAGGGVSDSNLCGGKLQTPPPTPPLEGRGERTRGFVEIVGAGPGDPDLISVRGRRMLERADLILYAGSLVPKALTDCHKPGAVVRSSADMNLEEQCALMKEHYDKGHFIVRLHTGDPCIFGAIQEQMAFFDREGMAYHITPGISSFLAAAAELKSQFTIPERTQTIILTRGEGRTPMPEREKLHLLARSQSTMCIFLSAAIVDDVQTQLLQHYHEDTPVAACYHLTWPDQKIYRGVLKDLARIVHDNHLTLTTMLVVGEAIDNRQGLSELYSKDFSHLYRKAGEAEK